MSHDNQLSGKQARALAGLLAGESIGGAADLVGVSRRTIERWLARPSFAAAYEQGRKGLLARLGGRVAGLVDRALTVAEQAMSSPFERTRLQGAALTLRYGLALLQSFELEGRVAALERQIGHGNQRSN